MFCNSCEFKNVTVDCVQFSRLLIDTALINREVLARLSIVAQWGASLSMIFGCCY